MQKVETNGSQRAVNEPRKPEPVQLDDWENEGGAAPPVVDESGASLFAKVERGVRGASRQLTQAMRTRPVVTLTAVFAVGLAVGGGLRYLKSGRLLMAVAAKPLFLLATGALLKK